MSELLPALRGAGEVDPNLTERVVARLNHAHERHTMAAMLALGTIVVDELFDGDPTAFRTRGAGHKTLAAVLAHEGLRASPDVVSMALRLVDLVHQLPPTVSEALDYTHHRMLLGVDDPTRRGELARLAAEQGWTTRVLQDEVAKHSLTQDRRGRGRPALPPHLRVLRRVAKSLESLRDEPLDPATLKREHVPEAVEHIEDAQVVLQELLLDVVRLHQDEHTGG